MAKIRMKTNSAAKRCLLFLGIIAGSIKASQIEIITKSAMYTCQQDGSTLKDLIGFLPQRDEVYSHEQPKLPSNYTQKTPLNTVTGTFSSLLENEYWREYNNDALKSLCKKNIISLQTVDDNNQTYQNYLDLYAAQNNKKEEEIAEPNLNTVKKDTTRPNLQQSGSVPINKDHQQRTPYLIASGVVLLAAIFFYGYCVKTGKSALPQFLHKFQI